MGVLPQDPYELFPERISKAAKDTLNDFKVTADAVVKASAEATKADLAKAVATASKEVAQAVVGKERLQWLTISVGC